MITLEQVRQCRNNSPFIFANETLYQLSYTPEIFGKSPFKVQNLISISTATPPVLPPGAGNLVVLEQETHGRYAVTFTHPTSTLSRLFSTPRQEHQFDRFLGIPEKRLARNAHLRTHGQPTR